MHYYPGRLITFEGGDGAGKTTQAFLLKAALHLSGIRDSLLTREPGGSQVAEYIRELLTTGNLNRWDSMTEALLYSAARRDHFIKSILPTLRAGKWVICDRFIDSTLAYQSGGYGIPIQKLKKLSLLILGKFRPDLTIILDVPPLVGLQRAQFLYIGQQQVPRYECMDFSFHNRVRNSFRHIAMREYSRCYVIDTSSDVASVHKVIWEIVTKHLLNACPK